MVPLTKYGEQSLVQVVFEEMVEPLTWPQLGYCWVQLCGDVFSST